MCREVIIALGGTKRCQQWTEAGYYWENWSFSFFGILSLLFIAPSSFLRVQVWQHCQLLIIKPQSFISPSSHFTFLWIIHYFKLMSSKLTLFALFFIFRHYSLFFQKYENNVINSLQFSKTFDYFRKILCEIQLVLQERFAHKALGLLLTAQSAFDREWDGLTRLLWTLFKHALTVFNTVLACFYSIKHCFVAKR